MAEENEVIDNDIQDLVNLSFDEVKTTDAPLTEEVKTETKDEVVIDNKEKKDDLEVVNNKVSDDLEVITEDKPITPIAETKEEIVDLEDKPFNVSKYTDGEFENINDLVDEYKKLKDSYKPVTNIVALLDEQSNEKFGMDFSEVMAWKNTDYEKMNEFDVLVEFEQYKDPEITQVELDAELEEFEVLNKSQEEIDQLIEDGEITAKEIKSIQAKFEKKVRNARQELSKFRDGINFDDIKVPTQIEQKQKPPTQEEILALKNNLKDNLKSFSKLRINLGDKDSQHPFDFMVTENDINNLVETLSNPNWIADRWKAADGSMTNSQAYYRDAYILSNLPTMLRASFNEGLVKGSKEQVMKSDNITLKDGRAGATPTNVDDVTYISQQLGLM